MCLTSLFDPVLLHEKQQTNEEIMKRVAAKVGRKENRACRLVLPGLTPSEHPSRGLLLFKFKLLLHSRAAGICLSAGEESV